MNILKYLSTFVFFLLFAGGCEDNNPEAPSEVQEISAYLPLKQGNTVRYSFECRYSKANGLAGYTNSIKGKLTINVTSIITRNNLLFAKLATDCSVLSDSTWNSLGPGYETEITAKEPYSILNEYNLIQSVDSVWKVTAAPDFSRLDEGSRSLVMHLPLEGDCSLNPDFIVLTGWDAGSELYKAEYRADTLIYWVHDDLHYVGGGPYKTSTIKFLKDWGLESIECTYGERALTLSPSYWEVTYTRD